MWTVFCIFIICFTLARNGSSSLPSLLHLTDIEDVRGQVCHRTSATIYSFVKNNHPNQYPKKPVEVPSNSPCAGMTATCCLPRKEVDLEPHVKSLYHKKLQDAMNKRLKSCKVMGRGFERALYANLRQSIKLLEKEISGIANTNITQSLFKDFFDFLYKFVYDQDFCPLTELVSKQIKGIFHVVFETKRQQNSSLLASNSCLESLETYYLDHWYNITLQNMIQSLNNIRLLTESFELVKSIITEIRKHKWNYKCVKALFKINHCAYCTGYVNFHTCDGNCLNALRGCTADIAELKPFIELLQTTLKRVTRIVQTEFHPAKFVQSTLLPFIQLAHHLNIIPVEGCQVDESEGLQALQQITTLKSLEYASLANITNELSASLRNDFTCFTQLKSLVLQFPEEMCGINPNHLAYIRNHDCWNGVSRGSYTHPIAGHYKANQHNNPAFINSTLPAHNPYQNKISNITSLVTDMNRTLSYYQCLESDDEDCKTKFVLYCREQISRGIDIWKGSGSGSGSGSGMGRYSNRNRFISPDDTERSGSSQIVIIVGGKRRFDDTDMEAQSSSTSATPTIRPTTSSSYSTSLHILTTGVQSSQVQTTSISSITVSLLPSTTNAVFVKPDSNIPYKSSSLSLFSLMSILTTLSIVIMTIFII